MNKPSGGKGFYEVFFATAGSFLLSLFPVGDIVFTFPLLLLSKRYPKKTTDTACVAVMVLVILRTLWQTREAAFEPLTWVFNLVTLFYPLSLILGAMVYVNAKRGMPIRSLILSTVPAFAMFFVIGVIFLLRSDLATGVYNAYEATVTGVLDEMFGSLGLDSSMLFALSTSVILSIAIAIVMTVNAVVFFLYEGATCRNSEDFNFKISRLVLPANFVYVFLGLWTLMLVKYFVDLPTFLALLINNATFSITALYAAVGFAIIYFNLRKRGSRMRVTRLFGLIVILLILLPGLNFVILIALPILGVLETWITLRKNEDEGVFLE